MQNMKLTRVLKDEREISVTISGHATLDDMLDAFRARREAALQARVNRVHALLLQRGPLSRAQIAAELRTNGDTTLDHLGILRGRGLVEVKKINRVVYYRAVQK